MGEPGGILARAWTRSAGYATDPPLAQLAGHDRDSTFGTHRAQLRVRLAKRPLLVGIRERQGSLVRTADCAPEVGCLRRLAGDRQRKWLGERPGRGLVAHARTPLPARELPYHPRRLQSQGERERRIGLIL